MLADRAYNTFKEASEVLVGSLDLDYVAHNGCVCRVSDDGRKCRKFLETAVLTIRKELSDGAGLNCLQWSIDHGEWLTAIPHCLNGTEFSR